MLQGDVTTNILGWEESDGHVGSCLFLTQIIYLGSLFLFLLTCFYVFSLSLLSAAPHYIQAYH